MPRIFTPFEIAKMRSTAKKLKKEIGCSHSYALDLVAKNNGYQTWALLMKNNTHKIHQATEIKEIYRWFTDQHNLVESPYRHPLVSPIHIINNRFIEYEKSNRIIAAHLLYSEGYWCSIEADNLMKSVAHPRRKRRIAGRYSPCSLLNVTVSDYDNIELTVPVIRAFPPTTKYEKERGYSGQLVFRCPICGSIHFHGAVGAKLGAGDGERVPHCDTSSPRNYHFILKEQTSHKLVGHLRKSIIDNSFLPK